MNAAPPPADLQDRIFGFLEALRRDGFRIGVREHVAARKLLVALRVEGRDIDVAELGAWLAPIVCASPADQAGFDERWRSWIATWRVDRTPPPPRPPPPERAIVRNWKRWSIAAAGVVVVAIVALVAARVALEKRERIAQQATPEAVRPAESNAIPPKAEGEQRPVETAAVSVVGWARGFEGRVLRGHVDAVSSIAFTSDGKTLVSGGIDSTIRLWIVEQTAARGQPWTGHRYAVRSVACSPDDRLVASGGEDGTIRLWSVEQGVARGKPWTGHTDRVNSVAFSLDGKLVVSGGVDGTIRLWSVEQGTARGQPLTGHLGSVRCVAFSLDGKLVASGGQDGTVRLWNVEEAAARGRPLTGHSGGIGCIAFSPDSKLVASGGQDGTVRLWNVEEAAARGRPMTGHSGWVQSVAFSPDGRLVASGGEDGTIRLWSVEQSGARGQTLNSRSGEVWSVAFSPHGELVASAGTDGTIRLWNLADFALPGEPQAALTVLGQFADSVSAAVFSPDGERVLTACVDGVARISDVNGKELTTFRGHEGALTSAVFSPDGERVLTASADRTARLFDVRGKDLTIFGGHQSSVSDAQFSPDGQRVVTASADGKIGIFDLDGNVLRVIAVREDVVKTAVFAPDGKHVLAASYDGTARLFDLEGKEQLVLRGHEAAVHCAAFSPDGQRIVIASDKTARIFDLAGEELAVLRGHDDTVVRAAFSPDGERVLTSSLDGTAAIWDAETAAPLRVLRGHSAAVNSAAFDADGERVVTASADQTVRVWDASESAPTWWPFAAIALAAFGAWSWLQMQLRRWSLRRRAAQPNDRIEKVLLPIDATLARDTLAARRHAVQLRRAVLVGSDDIDVERTVARTVDSGGFVQVVRRGRPHVPEYLALVERLSPRDHLARYVDDRLARLRDEFIHIEQMSFLREPSVVFVPKGRGRYVPLADLHAQHPGHRVWAIGEARLASSAIASRASWLEELEAWPHRSFIVADRADATPELARTLARAELRLASLDEPVNTLDEPSRVSAGDHERSAAFPPSLLRDAGNWTSPTPPDEHRVHQALDEVKRYLGADRFRWFAACAVYPELYYELTLQIGHLVLPSWTIRDEDVVRLARLPWFRRGQMPDWLRQALLAELPREDEERVRDWFLRVFTSDARVAGQRTPASAAGLELPITQAARGPVSAEFHDVAAQRRKNPSADPAFRDAVFLDWMEDRLSVAVPRRIVREIRRRARADSVAAAPTLRPWWRALLGAFAAALVITLLANPLGEWNGVRAGAFASTVYAVLIAAARRLHGRRWARPVLALELFAVFLGVAFAESRNPMHLGNAQVIAVVFRLPVLAWLTFELLAMRARRRGGSTRFERIADGLMLDRLFEWLGRDFSRGEPVAIRKPATTAGFLTTPLLAAAVVAGAWKLEGSGPPHEWAWAITGLVLGLYVLASAVADPKRSTKYWWVASAVEALTTSCAVLLVSAWMTKDVAWANGSTLVGVLTIGAAVLAACLSALRRRRHPLYTAITPVLALCDAIVVDRWIHEVLAKRRERRLRTAPEASA